MKLLRAELKTLIKLFYHNNSLELILWVYLNHILVYPKMISFKFFHEEMMSLFQLK